MATEHGGWAQEADAPTQQQPREQGPKARVPELEAVTWLDTAVMPTKVQTDY